MWTVTTFENHDIVQRTYEDQNQAYLDALCYHLRWFDSIREYLDDNQPPIFKKDWIKSYLQFIQKLRASLENNEYDNNLYADEEFILTNELKEVKLVYTISNQKLYFYTDMFENATFVQVDKVFE